MTGSAKYIRLKHLSQSKLTKLGVKGLERRSRAIGKASTKIMSDRFSGKLTESQYHHLIEEIATLATSNDNAKYGIMLRKAMRKK